MSTSSSDFAIEQFTTEIGAGFRLKNASNEALAFFGNRHSTRERVEKEFPQFELVAVRQTHSDILIQSSAANLDGERAVAQGEAPEADAHWTGQKNLSLAIRTADCVPVLVFDLKNSRALAIHAGWRGVENEIIVKSMKTLKANGLDPKSAIAFVGPHIMRESFEVGLDVAQSLKTVYLKSLQAHPHERFSSQRLSELARDLYLDPETISGADPSLLKTFVDLDRIVEAQLEAVGIESSRQQWLKIDTVVSADHESFRRGKANSGRQISFATLIK